MESQTPSLDVSRPNAARMYDYYLGGSHNFEADREAADAVEAAWPGAKAACWANRAFLRRVVRHLSENGVDQFLDLGSGVPTEGNVHEVAQQVNPNARVLYVDSEPVAYHAGRQMLASNPSAACLQADLRDPHAILGSQTTTSLLDFSRPVAVMMVAVLHFVPGDVAGHVAAYRDALPSGSYLVVSHATPPWDLPAAVGDDAAAAVEVYRNSSTPLHYRSESELVGLFAGLELVAPGVTHVLDWRPEEEVDPTVRARIAFSGGVARKP